MFGFDTLIPFIVTKEEAVELFKKKINKKWFMPKLAKQRVGHHRCISGMGYAAE